MSLLGAVTKLNSNLDNLKEEFADYQKNNSHDFIAYSSILEKLSLLFAQANIFAQIHTNGVFMETDLIDKVEKLYKDQLIFPTQAEVMAHEALVEEFMGAVLNFSNKVDEVSKHFKTPAGNFHPQFALQLMVDRLSRKQATTSAPRPSPATTFSATAVPSPSCPGSSTRARDDEGVSFVKKKGFLLNSKF